MGKWKYDLKEDGKKLRALIDQGASKTNCEKILNHVIVCCERAKALMESDDREEYEFDFDVLITDCEDMRFYLEEDDEDYNGEEIDEMLSRFYDLMDVIRVWIAF